MLRKFRLVRSPYQPQTGFLSLPHLAEGSWVDFELKSAQALASALESELNKLKRRVSKERVHKSRVALRRWFSVWSVLEEDGWDSKKFRKSVIKPLKKLLKKLGSVRDLDVNIDLARKLGCDKALIKKFARQRRKSRRTLETLIKSMDVAEITGGINSYLSNKAERLKSSLEKKGVLDNSPYTHFDRYLSRHELRVKRLAKKARSPEALHELRLAIKHWRYLLVECMGLSNGELVMAQQYLGDIHDLDRFRLVLEKIFPRSRPLRKLKSTRQQLLDKFDTCRYRLPYGLRPGLRSFKDASP